MSSIPSSSEPAGTPGTGGPETGQPPIEAAGIPAAVPAAPAPERDLGVLKLSSPATREYWEIRVLYEDEHLLAVEKPAGLLTSPDRYDPERPNLMRLLHGHVARGVPWARERGISYLANAHRLDFETSGILLLARTKPALVHLANQFGAEKPKKTYLAIVDGGPEDDAFEVDARLAPDPVRVGRMRVSHKHGKRSRTEFKVVTRFAGFTLMEAYPWTGRTHQIRVHLAWVKLPLIGDSLYGGRPLMLSAIKRGYRKPRNREEQPLIKRVALHASVLEVTHPVTGEPVRIECPLPRDFAVALKYLRRFALPGGAGWGNEAAGTEAGGGDDSDGED